MVNEHAFLCCVVTNIWLSSVSSYRKESCKYKFIQKNVKVCPNFWLVASTSTRLHHSPESLRCRLQLRGADCPRRNDSFGHIPGGQRACGDTARTHCSTSRERKQQCHFNQWGQSLIFISVTCGGCKGNQLMNQMRRKCTAAVSIMSTFSLSAVSPYHFVCICII